MESIVSDEDIRSGEPRIEGSRITVQDVKRRVIDEDEDPHVVAGEYEITLAELFSALAYYYENRDAFEARERKASARRREGNQRTRQIVESIEQGEDEAAERAD